MRPPSGVGRESRCAAAGRRRCRPGSGSVRAPAWTATRTARAARASGPGRRKCRPGAAPTSMPPVTSIRARTAISCDAGHADSHGLLAEIAPAREIALQLIDGGGSAAHSIGELRRAARAAAVDSTAARAATRIPGTTSPGCAQHRRDPEQQPR